MIVLMEMDDPRQFRTDNRSWGNAPGLGEEPHSCSELAIVQK